jgi:hypothetical protein
MCIRFALPVPLRDPCNNRISGRRGVACGVRDNSDRASFAELAKRRARDVYHGGLLNVAFLDLA